MTEKKLPWTCPGCGNVQAWSRRSCGCGFDADLFSRLAHRIVLEARGLPASAIPLLVDLSLWRGGQAAEGPAPGAPLAEGCA